MTEDLQHLLDKIQKDGVEKAEAEASRIVSEANAKAEEIIKQAKEESETIVKKAEKDAEAFEEKGRKSLEQAARDVIISAKTGITTAVDAIIKTETSAAMDDATVSEMLIKVIDAYCKEGGATEVSVSENDVEKFKGFILNKLNEQAQKGITIVPQSSISKGFRVELKDKNIEHDLTDTSVSEALARVLRPHIAEILRESSK